MGAITIGTKAFRKAASSMPPRTGVGEAAMCSTARQLLGRTSTRQRCQARQQVCLVVKSAGKIGSSVRWSSRDRRTIKDCEG